MSGENFLRDGDGVVPLGPKYGTLLAVCLAIFLEPLQATVVSVALPDIQQGLGASYTGLQWVVNAYTLTAGALLLPAGALADRYGRRRVFNAGLVLFALTSILCGVAISTLMLNLARALQGVAAAAIYTTTLALLVQEFEGRERAMAFGVWGAVVGLGFVLGPLIGGLVVQGLSWRWIFFAMVPVSLIVIGLTMATVRESSDPDAARLDWLGAVTSTAAFFLLIYGIVSGNERGWTSFLVAGSFVGGLVLLGVFALIERRKDRPMMELSFFRDRTFTGASIVPVVLSVSFFSYIIYLPLYFQAVAGYSALRAGIALLPLVVPLAVVGSLSSRIAARVSSKTLLSLGQAIVGVGLLYLVFVGAESHLPVLSVGLVVSGIGAGILNGEMSNVAVSAVPEERSGMASGINFVMRNVGFAFGVALLGAILGLRVATRIKRTLTTLGVGNRARAGSLTKDVLTGEVSAAAARLPPNVQDEFVRAAQEAFTSGMNLTFVVGAVIAFGGAIAAFVLVEQTPNEAGAEDEDTGAVADGGPSTDTEIK